MARKQCGNCKWWIPTSQSDPTRGECDERHETGSDRKGRLDFFPLEARSYNYCGLHRPRRNRKPVPKPVPKTQHPEGIEA